MSEMSPERAPAASGTAHGRAASLGQIAYEAHTANRGLGWERLADRHRESWEAVAQAVIESFVQQPGPLVVNIDGELTEADAAKLREQLAEAVRNPRPAPELAATMAETRQYREQVAAARERLTALVDRFELSANASHPSKKSEIERQCAQAVRAVAETITATAPHTLTISPRLPLPDESREAYEAYLDTLFAPVRAEMDRLQAASAITPAGTEHTGTAT